MLVTPDCAGMWRYGAGSSRYAGRVSGTRGSCERGLTGARRGSAALDGVELELPGDARGQVLAPLSADG